MADNTISITLPANARWMRFAQDSLRSYSKMVGFSRKLEDMCSGSVMEACEELMRKSREAGVDDPIGLVLDYRGETIVVDITYSGRIPLNPHQTGEYEVPDAGTRLDDLDMDTLWLHMIKRRMDRVHFMVRGSRHVLRMVKYRRDEGREKQAWVMTITPELRPGVILHLDSSEAEHPASTLQAKGKGVLKLGPSETFFIRNMDGKRSFHDLYMAHIDALGLVSPDVPAGLYERLEVMGMLAEPEGKAGKSRLGSILGAIIHPDISIPKADRVVTAVHRRTRFLFSPLGLALLLAAGLSGAIPCWLHHAQFTAVVMNLEKTIIANPLIILPVYVLTFAHIVLHELGHGVTCKHYGGMVPRLGLMFYLASFIFYCDTTAAWNFPSKTQRILVSLGGPLVSFAILGAGLWGAGLFAGTGSLWESVFVAFSLLNLLVLAMNFNPFIKMDAYYMLLDLIGIPNLRARSFKFLERRTLGWLGFGSKEDTKATLRERKIFWWYGILGGLATLAFIALPILRLNRLLTAESVSGGRLLLVVCICGLLVIRLGNITFRKIQSVRYREYKIQ